MARIDNLNEIAKRAGLYVRTYSPGDGVTRYRFFKLAPDGSERSVKGADGRHEYAETNGYFGPENGIHTALGLKAAITFADAYGAGRNAAVR